jgi:hypothetical protein
MTEHFNNLTPAQLERLAKLAEEAGEVVQIAMKIMRHGYASHNPDRPQDGSNQDQLVRELNDLYKIATTMWGKCDIYEYPHQINGHLNYMHHQGE